MVQKARFTNGPFFGEFLLRMQIVGRGVFKGITLGLLEIATQHVLCCDCDVAACSIHLFGIWGGNIRIIM